MNKNISLPLIPMRGLVAFPKMVMHFDVAREKSVNAVKYALEHDRKIILVAQKDVMLEDPKDKDLYRVGVIAEIRQTLKTPDNIMRVLVEGVDKINLNSAYNDDETNSVMGDAEIIPNYIENEENSNLTEVTAIIRSLKDIFETYSSMIPQMPKELLLRIQCEDDPYAMFESIAYNMTLDFKDKQTLLEEDEILIRLSMLYGYIVREVDVLRIERQIHEQVKENIDKGQREYYLREQMKVISEQLDEDEEVNEDIAGYYKKISQLDILPESSQKLIQEVKRLSRMPQISQESMVIRDYLDNCLSLPWNTASKIKLDINKAKNILDKEHYGLEKVKGRVLESIAVHALTPNITGQIICLVGPPGVGKTSIGRSIAKALGRKYTRISLGGIKDESDIRGHRKTYVGAMPGRIINALKQAGTNNPLMLLDEIDKMSNDFRGDPSSAMLEVLDSEQNKDFRDHYIELPFDLSKVLFITTANTTHTIPAPLLDRMEVIELVSYTREEKYHIAREHLLSKQIKKNGLKASQMKMDESAIYGIIDFYTREAGVRTLERTIAALCRKTAKAIVAGEAKRIVFTSDNLEKYLGVKKYLPENLSLKDEIGIVNGLAWTAVGGVLMPLEVLVLNGRGSIETTGSLGNVMKESAKIAVSYSRSVAEKYNINPDFYKQNDLHIHAPEGAVPKDGPSAGVTMVTAVVSALSGIPVRGDIAMTGEITLHGKVLPIGGLREKTMAAYKSNIKTVIIPKGNESDIEEIDEIVKNNISFVLAENLKDVLDIALVSNTASTESKKLIHQDINNTMVHS